MAADLMGIDIGTYAAKVVMLGGIKGRKANLVGMGLAQLPTEVILNWEEQPGPAKVAIGQAMRQLKAINKLPAHYVSTSLSGDSIVVKKISMPVPAVAASDLKAAITLEAEQYIPYSINEVNLSYHILHPAPVGAQMTVLIVAARKDLVQNYIEAISLAKLKPAVIDIDGLALSNAYEFVNPGNRDNVVLLDLGANHLHITVLHQGQPLAIKEEHGGGQRLTDELAGLYNISNEEAEAVKFGAEPSPNPGETAEVVDRAANNWIAALERILDAVKTEVPSYDVQGIQLAGGSCLIPGLTEEFQRYFNIETRLFNPLLSTTYNTKKFDPEYIKYVGPQMAVSFGLALRKVEIQ